MELSPLFRELASFPVARDDRDRFFFTKDGHIGQLHRTGFRVRELPGGKVVADIELFDSPPRAVAIGTNDDRVAVTTSAFFDRAHVVVFDLARLNGPAAWIVDPASVRHIDRGGQRLAFDGSARRLVCANASRAVWVFDARTGEREAFLRLGDPFLVDAVMRCDGEELVVAAAGRPGRLHAWRLRDPAPYAECNLTADVQSMVLAPDDATLAILTSEGVALARLAPTGPAIAWRTAPARPLAWTPYAAPTFGWLDDEHFAVLVPEQAATEAQPLCSELFLYVFAARSEQWLLRVRVDDFADIATDPRSRRLVYSNEVHAHVFEFGRAPH